MIEQFAMVGSVFAMLWFTMGYMSTVSQRDRIFHELVIRHYNWRERKKAFDKVAFSTHLMYVVFLFDATKLYKFPE